MIGVIIPARNEAQRIERCLESVRAAISATSQRALVVVVADACCDDTARRAQALADKVLTTSEGCVGGARRAGCAAAIEEGCEWLAHTDADSEVPPEWLLTQRASNAALYCGTVRLGPSRWLSPTVRRLYASRYRGQNGHQHVHGANFGIDVLAYRQLGGFASLASHEDVDLVRRAERAGLTIAWCARAPVLTSARLNARAPEGFAAYLARLAVECNVEIPTRDADALRVAASS